MKKNKKGWLFLITGLFLLTNGVIFGTAVTEALRNANGVVSINKVVAMVKPQWKGGETLNIEMVKKIQEEYYTNLLTYTVKTPTGQKVTDWSDKRFDAVIGGVNNIYSMFHSFNFLNGCFFPPNQKDGVLKTALISEEFSWKIFRTLDTTGMSLVLYGETFRIAGVFKIHENILNTLVHPYMPDILLPANTMLLLDDRAYIDSIEFAVDDSIMLGGNVELILSVLRLAGADPDRFIALDFVTGEKSVRQRPFLLVFIAGLAVVFMIGTYTFRAISERTRLIWALRMDGYSRRGIFSIIFKEVLKLILPIVIIIMVVLFFYRSGFDFYFPTEYIPGETLDEQKYQELFRESLRKLFSGINEEAPANVRILQAANLISGFFFRLAFLFGFLLARAGIAILGCEKGLFAKAVLAQLACVLASYALCLKMGLPPITFVGGLIILWLFIFVMFTVNSGCIAVQYQETLAECSLRDI